MQYTDCESYPANANGGPRGATDNSTVVTTTSMLLGANIYRGLPGKETHQ